MRERGTTSGAIRFALAIVVAHALIVALHAAAHQILDVRASKTQTFFIVIVIMIAPVLAGILLLQRVRVIGAVLLTGSMVGSLVFGVYNHFIISSPDHVSHVSVMTPVIWAVIFQVTAVLLAVAEIFGVCAGVWTLSKRSGRII